MCEIVRCLKCGQPLPPKQREGVWLSAKKVEIFDFIDKHPGITAEGILYHCFAEGTNQLVRQHIYQINELLAGTRVRISGCEPRARGEYQVIRGKRAPIAREPRKRGPPKLRYVSRAAGG
jgi:hypothetical protein